MMSFEFPARLTTLQQARQCQQELQSIVSDGATLEAAHMSADLTELAQINGYFANNQLASDLLEKLEKAIASAPTFEVFLAAEPSAMLLQEIVTWFRDNLHKQSLLTYKIRRSILGGAIVRTRNHMYDFSFRPKIMATKGRFAEVLHRV